MHLDEARLIICLWDLCEMPRGLPVSVWWKDGEETERGREVIRARATTGLVLTFPEDEVKVIPSASLGGWLLHKIR